MHKLKLSARRTFDIAVLLSFGALQFAFAAGMPWFDGGIWPQIEGPTIAIHFISAALALFVGTMIAMEDPRHMKAARSPVVVVLFCFAAFSALLAPFSDDLARTLQGTLKYRVGVVWHFEFALAVLAAAALWQDRGLRRAMLGMSATATVAVLGLYVFPDNPLGLPISFPEWSGLLAFAVGGALVISAGKTEKSDETIGIRLGAAIVGVLLVVVGIYISGNRAVLLGTMAVVSFLIAGKVPFLAIFSRSRVIRSLVATVISVFFALALQFAAPVIESASIPTGAVKDTVASHYAIDHVAIQDGFAGTLWSRSYLVRVQIADLFTHPSKLLTGNGFGYFSTIYEYNVRNVPGRLFPNPTPTSSMAYWDAHTSANFHSHNMLTETLSATGIGGALLWLLAFGVLSWYSARGAAVAIGFAVVGSFWFPLSYMIGPMALVIGAVATADVQTKRRSSVVAALGSLIAVFGLSVFGYLGAMSLSLSSTELNERAFAPVEVNSDPATCGFIKTDVFPEREIVTDLYSILITKITRAEIPTKALLDATTNAISINCMLRRYYEQEGDIKALSASLKGRAALVPLGPASYGALRKEIVKWGDDLERMLDMAPGRTELLVPYITTLGERAPNRVPEAVARFMPRLSEYDPVRPYLLSVKARLEGDMSAHDMHFDEAMRYGLANLWPMKKADKNTSKQGKP